MRTIKTHLDYYRARDYFRSMADQDGVALFSDLQIGRILGICICVASPNDKKYKLPHGSKWVSSNFLSTHYKNYNELLTKLVGNDVISFYYKEKMKKGVLKTEIVRIATLNPSYLLEDPITVKIPNVEYQNVITHTKKLSKYGNIHSANEGIKVEVEYDDFVAQVTEHLLKKDPDKSQEQLQQDLKVQWRTICAINKSGRINPRKPRKGRCSSRITEISSPMDSYITIDGEDTVVMDQHATYLTLLPEVLKSRVSKEEQTEEFRLELEKMREVIRVNDNLYAHISEAIGIDINQIKVEVNRFFCDPKANRTYEYSFYKYFEQEFPLLNKGLLFLRCKKGPYSEFNKIESSIFSGAAKRLIKLGIKAITKYDSLIVKSKDESKAKEILDFYFQKANITNKTKIKENNYKTSNSKIQENIENLKECKRIKENREEENRQQEKEDRENTERENVENVETEHRGVHRGTGYAGAYTALSPDFDPTTLKSKVVEASQIRSVNNNGSLAWVYRGTGSQRLKVSQKKYTLDQVVEMVNKKFESGEWK